MRAVSIKRGSLFAVERLMLNRLIGLLAGDSAADKRLAFLSRLGARAIAARAIFRLRDDPRMEQFHGVNMLPGFAAALAEAHQTLKENHVDPSRLRSLGGAGNALAALLEQFDMELLTARLLDRAGMIETAIRSLTEGSGRRFAEVSLVLLDLTIESQCERDLVAALVTYSPAVIATVPAGDERSEKLLAEALDLTPKEIEQPEVTGAETGTLPTSLARLQRYLFAAMAPAEAPRDGTVTVRPAAGEMQECVEIARDILAEAKSGTPFDRIALLLHTPERYAPYVREALARAGIPAWFARGASLPEPGGRALLALLNCAAERFSARRFAEYLSLAQLPETELQPAIALARAAPLCRRRRITCRPALKLRPLRARKRTQIQMSRPPSRAPWRWEQLLVDAAVVNGRERWEKRLQGLENELRLQRGEVDDDDARAALLERKLTDLAASQKDRTTNYRTACCFAKSRPLGRMAATAARTDDVCDPRRRRGAANARRPRADGAGWADHARRGSDRVVGTARAFILTTGAPPLWGGFRCADFVRARTRIRCGDGAGSGRAHVSEETDRRSPAVRFDAARD